MTRKPGETLFLIFLLAALAGSFYLLTPPGLASNDEGVHYVQMKNFTVSGSFEITSPAQSLGFESADVTGMRGLLEARDGRLYATPPPLFPWVSSLFFPVFGERTVDFAPILFVFLSVLVLGLILDRVMQRDFLYWLLLAAFLLGSPVLMQGFQFSGMALALLMIVSALWLLASHFGDHPSAAKLFGAAFLMGVSAIVRMECMLIALSFCVSATVAFVFQKRMKDLWTVLAGGIFGLAVFVLHDVLLHGRFPGPYLQMYLPFYALSPIRVAALGGSLGLSFVLITLSLREGIGPVRKAVLSILSIILVFSAVLLTAARISIAHLMALFPAVLFVFYGVPGRLERLKKGEGALEAILAVSVVLCLVFGAAILRPGAWIVSSAWLPMVPAVILLLSLERKTIFASRGMYLVLAFFCGVAFVNGIQESKDRILKYKDYNAARIAFLEKHTSAGDAILFLGDTGSMEHAGPLFFDRVFLVAKSPGDTERFARRLRERGIDGIHAWTLNPMGIKGFNPYGGKAVPTFPPPPGSKSCCGKSCKERNAHLVRLDTRSIHTAGAGRGGS
jgi:predicted membrane protein